jgi:hypothetical protein
MEKATVTLIGVVALLTATSFADPRDSGKSTKGPTLTVVLAKTNVLGSFLTDGAVCSDKSNIYLASYEGNLFVIDKSKKDYPVVAVIRVSAAPLRSVRSDGQKIYVTCGDGNLYVYGATKGFPQLAVVLYSRSGLNSLYVNDESVILSQGQGEMTANGQTLYLSELNQGDTAFGIHRATLIPVGQFGQTFQPAATVAYDRSSGAQLGSIPNPPDLFGRVGAVNLYVHSDILMQTIPGCCGSGLYMYDIESLGFLGWITRPFANAAITLRSGLLAIGTEAGTVEVFDITNPSAPQLVTSADLRQLTGHTGPEDIEIRSLWEDKQTGRIYAGSSWGNDVSRGPSLPAFFVLDLNVRDAD